MLFVGFAGAAHMTDEESHPLGKVAKEWLPKVYQELRRKAQLYLNREQPGHVLNATALVHEAYIKLSGGDSPADFEKTGHFYAAAAEAMRRILVDHARAQLSQKRGGEGKKLGQSQLEHIADLSKSQSPEEFLALDQAVSRLGGQDLWRRRLSNFATTRDWTSSRRRKFWAFRREP